MVLPAAGDGSHRVDCEQLSALLRSRDNCGSHLSPDLGFIKRSEQRCGCHKLRQSLSTSELAKSAFEMVVRNLSEVAKPHVTFDTSSSPLPRPSFSKSGGGAGRLFVGQVNRRITWGVASHPRQTAGSTVVLFFVSA